MHDGWILVQCSLPLITEQRNKRVLQRLVKHLTRSTYLIQIPVYSSLHTWQGYHDKPQHDSAEGSVLKGGGATGVEDTVCRLFNGPSNHRPSRECVWVTGKHELGCVWCPYLPEAWPRAYDGSDQVDINISSPDPVLRRGARRKRVESTLSLLGHAVHCICLIIDSLSLSLSLCLSVSLSLFLPRWKHLGPTYFITALVFIISPLAIMFIKSVLYLLC